MRAIPDIAVDFIAKHEGKRLTAYQDQVGVWTIGYGHTGPEVKAGQTISLAEAKRLLKADLADAAGKIERKIGPVVGDLTENQYAALLSFVFNLGSGNPAKREWTIWQRLRARDFDQVPLEMMKFVNAGGRKLQGLVNRRTDEVRLWSTEEPGSSAERVPSSVTRETATPPTPSDPTPPAKSGPIITMAAGAAASIPVAADQVSKAIAPYADRSELVQRIVAGLALVAALAVALGLALAWLKSRQARS